FESPDYRIIGDIVHEALHQLYLPYLNSKPVGMAEIGVIKENLEVELKKAYFQILKTNNIETGRNRIVYDVMKRLLEGFFEKEGYNSGFKITMLEREIKRVYIKVSMGEVERKVSLGGTIDRLDIKDGTFRVIDYKTGKVNSLNMEDLEKLSGDKAVERKEVFQLLFYRYLLKQIGYKGEYKLGVYPFKKLSEELKFVKIGGDEVIDDVIVSEFEAILIEIFREIFDPAEPFRQAGTEDNCGHCPYNNICSRGAGEYTYY
ncbi:MAG: PD-(D/E)XK nuclease family protein, partial [bacterium]|nr:PD-(D/E)XK nuclease family protein [bacterium]